MDNKIVSFEARAWMSTPEGKPGQPLQSNFLPIDFPKKKLGDESGFTYHVYSNKKEYKTVEAQTASQAIELSGIKEPYKVSRTGSDLGNIVDSSTFVKEAAAPVPKEPEAPAAPVAEAVPSEPKKE